MPWSGRNSEILAGNVRAAGEVERERGRGGDERERKFLEWKLPIPKFPKNIGTSKNSSPISSDHNISIQTSNKVYFMSTSSVYCVLQLP